tara:strand:+ start:214 stop:882 length:669 start_codon:yes stop_codon:yes gene_type:complete
MYGQITQIQSYDYEDLPIHQKQDRMEYLNRLIFYTDRVYDHNPNPLQDKYLEEAFGVNNENFYKFQKLREEFYAILKQWANYEFSFTPEIMQKYTPIYKGVATPFKNVGHPNLSTFESKFGGSSKYYGLSHGRSLSEFIRDANNPANRITIPTPATIPAPVVEVQKPTQQNIPKQTDPLEIAETEIILEQDAPVIDHGNNYYLIGLVGLIVVALFFIMRRKK